MILFYSMTSYRFQHTPSSSSSTTISDVEVGRYSMIYLNSPLAEVNEIQLSISSGNHLDGEKGEIRR